jgi:hypothetical protein
VLIANPIYDVVFRYLLDDQNVARLLLSALLGQEVLELQFRPAEAQPAAAEPDGTQFLVVRVGFAATVRLEDGGRKPVLVEVQKARNARDVQRRFRRYLAFEEVHLDPGGEMGELPVLTILFLGEGLEGVDVPVLRINHRYRDVATGEDVRITDPLVEALTRDAIVVQVNRLKQRRRTELERLLGVFDQSLASFSYRHMLDILEESVPERQREVLWRLMRAGAEQKILDKMDLEDDILAAFQDEVRKFADLVQALGEKEQALEAKDQVIEEKNQVIEGKDKALEEKDRLIADLLRRLSGS